MLKSFIFKNLPIPPTLNTLYPTYNNRRIKSQKGKEWEQEMNFALKSKENITEFQKALKQDKNQKVLVIVQCNYFYVKSPRKQDVDNRLKVVIDYFSGKIYKDDNQVIIACAVKNEMKRVLTEDEGERDYCVVRIICGNKDEIMNCLTIK